MSKTKTQEEPNVIFANRTRISVREKNGTAHTWKAAKGYLRIQAGELTREVRELLYAQGGMPEIEQPWYLRRDAGEVTISWRIESASGFQTGGQPEYETFEHRHKPLRGTGLLARACDRTNCDDEHCEHVIDCGNPHCQDFFNREWRTYTALLKARRPHDPAPIADFLPIAAPSKEQRPRTVPAHERWLETSYDELGAKSAATAMGAALGEKLREFLPGIYQPSADKA